MKVYETVSEYQKEAKLGDRIVLGGRGILDGLKHINKASTFKVVKIKEDGSLVFKAYRGRVNLVLGADSYDQKVGILIKQDFDQLSVY